MKSFLRIILEFVVFATTILCVLFIAAKLMPEPPSSGAPSQKEVMDFISQCDGRTVLVRNKLECRA